MPRDHQLLVCRNYIDRNTASARGDETCLLLIRADVEFSAQPFQSSDYFCPDSWRIFPNAAGEDKAVKSSHSCSKHTGMHSNSVYEIVDSESRMIITAKFESSHVTAYPDKAFRPDSWYKVYSSSFTLRPRFFMRKSITPGSVCP